MHKTSVHKVLEASNAMGTTVIDNHSGTWCIKILWNFLNWQWNDEMCGGKSKVAWIRECNYIFKGIRSSSLGTTCHRDEDSFIKYKDGYWMMTDKGKVKSKNHDDN